MTSADKAWLTLGVGVIGYDVLAADGQTLSEGADKYMLNHPWITRGVAFALVAHVCNMVAAKYDPIHLMFSGLRAIR